MGRIVSLDRAYPSRFGAPVLHRVDLDIFRLRYFTHCMRCTWCADACCHHGVDIDVENVARVMAHRDALERHVGRPATEWFTGSNIPDAEFPGGAHTRTRVIDGACVFLGQADRGCLLHSFCLKHGMDYHDLKPMVSALFPITFGDGALLVATEVSTGELICSGAGPTLYEGLRDEMAHYFGIELVDALDGVASTTPSVPD